MKIPPGGIQLVQFQSCFHHTFFIGEHDLFLVERIEFIEHVPGSGQHAGQGGGTFAPQPRSPT